MDQEGFVYGAVWRGRTFKMIGIGASNPQVIPDPDDYFGDNGRLEIEGVVPNEAFISPDEPMVRDPFRAAIIQPDEPIKTAED